VGVCSQIGPLSVRRGNVMPYRRTEIQIRLQDNNDFIIGLKAGTFMVEKRRALCTKLWTSKPAEGAEKRAWQRPRHWSRSSQPVVGLRAAGDRPDRLLRRAIPQRRGINSAKPQNQPSLSLEVRNHWRFGSPLQFCAPRILQIDTRHCHRCAVALKPTSAQPW
jgi:hypothetical protein